MYNRDYYLKHKEEHLKRTKEYRESNPDKVKNKKLVDRYGITLEDYNQMFIEQEGKCAICGKHQSELQRALFVDHDHNTGEVRGLLCNNCNAGVGYFEDKPDYLEKAIAYLGRYNG